MVTHTLIRAGYIQLLFRIDIDWNWRFYLYAWYKKLISVGSRHGQQLGLDLVAYNEKSKMTGP